MDEYISRENTLDVIREMSQRHTDELLAEFAYNIVSNIPAADVQPVKHGYWEELEEYGDTHYRCSVCGEEWYLEDGKPKDNNMNFCPRCGARMIEDGEQND